MSYEICKQCGIDATPWSWSHEYNGYICIDCSYEDEKDWLILREDD